ncbi:MAG: substrate-binding domain-containing protein [bacterium]|nr:substrate-binding domain-containing protein [bacterium]
MRIALAVLSILVLAAGCGPAPVPSTPPDTPDAGSGTETAATDAPIRVGFVTNSSSDFWTIARVGTDKACQELGCEVEFRIPAGGTAQEQQQIVESLVAMQVSGIAISPKDPENQTEMLDAAAAKVNVVTQDSDAPESNRVCYIGTNNYQAGVAAGELIKQALPDGGKIMLFVGTLDAQNAQDRKKGIEDTIAGTNITVIDTRTDETDRTKAIANVQSTLVAHPDVACLVGLWSYNGPSILNGVQDSRKLGQVKIVCFDEEDETLRGVKDGHIFGTIVQQPFEFGYRSVQVLVELAKGDRSSVPEDDQIFVPVKAITKDNVDEFWSELKRLTGKS